MTIFVKLILWAMFIFDNILHFAYPLLWYAAYGRKISKWD